MISETPPLSARAARRPLPRRRFLHALAFAGCLGLLAASARAEVSKEHADASKEYEIKAAYLYNFAKFVEWPPGRFATPTSPIVIGVVGKNPFGEELEATVEGRKVNGRNVTVVAVSCLADARSVHVLFVPAGEEKCFDPRTAGGVLTVGDSDHFAELGGMITFVPQADKIRFAINLDAAERAGLKVSAQLLKLASAVQRKSP